MEPWCAAGMQEWEMDVISYEWLDETKLSAYLVLFVDDLVGGQSSRYARMESKQRACGQP